MARPVTEITSAFFEALEQQPWKGNIRELRNVIERSLIVCEGEGLDVADRAARYTERTLRTIR